MRRRKTIYSIGLASLSFFHGCTDAPSSLQATTDVELSAPPAVEVSLATHYELAPQVTPWLASEENTSNQSFRPLYRLPRVNQAVASRVPYSRLPEIACETPASTNNNASILKRTEVVSNTTVPTKRFRRPKEDKLPLPNLAARPVSAPSGSTGWLLTGTALHSVSQQADATIERAFILAEKGAYYSARTEFKQALRTVAQAMDAHFGVKQHSEALAAGWLALDEVDDFSSHSRRSPHVNVQLIVGTHHSTVLKAYELADVSPVLAMQHYFTFAQEQLSIACGSAPVASRALYGLGKVHLVLSARSTSAERLHGPKAMAFHQAALANDPENHLAANELGVLLARFGKLQEARSVLQHSANSSPLSQTWQNLSIVHHRLGEAELAAQSMAIWRRTLQQSETQPNVANNRSMVQWVGPEQFIGQQQGAPKLPPKQPSVRPETPPEQAKKKGFLWW